MHPLKNKGEPGMVIHPCNPSTGEANLGYIVRPYKKEREKEKERKGGRKEGRKKEKHEKERTNVWAMCTLEGINRNII
jgi:hypothetical protein